jgi:hypothetical protein
MEPSRTNPRVSSPRQQLSGSQQDVTGSPAPRHERDWLRQRVDSAVPAVALSAQTGEVGVAREMLVAGVEQGSRDQ